MKNIRIGIASLLMVMLILSMVVPAVSAQDLIKVSTLANDENDLSSYNIEGLDAQKVADLQARISYQQSLPEVIQQAPYRAMISADARTQKAILGHIDNFSVSNTEKEEMKKAMIDIWSRVPDNITKDDYPTLTKIGDTLEAYLGETYWEDMNSVKWYETPHEDLIYFGVKGVYNNVDWANAAKYSAYDPDNGTLDSGLMRFYNHYYNPTYRIGGAPSRCSEFANLAQTNYANNKDRAFYYLGLSSHYISDVGNPMHTDGEWKQIFNTPSHIAYESYVSSNWSSGYNYKSIVSSNTATNTVTNPSTAAKNLAAFSNPYFDTLWQEITENPSGFGADIDVRYITTSLIRETAKYNRGLAAYIKT